VNYRKSRTSGAKALTDSSLYGTAEAVPFVKSLFPIGLKPSSTDEGVPFVKSLFPIWLKFSSSAEAVPFVKNFPIRRTYRMASI
jgi:hypothetical protein